MKKIVKAFILSIFITACTTISASALIIDPSQIVAKASDIVQKVKDATEKITQQIKQTEQMLNQGFNFDTLKTIGKEYFNIDEKYLTKQLQARVKGTKEKTKESKEAERDLYSESAKELYNVKVDEVGKDLALAMAIADQLKLQISTTKQELAQAETEYEQAEEGDEKAEKFTIYSDLEMELEELENALLGVNAQIVNLQTNLNELNKEKSEVGTEKDETFVAYNRDIENLENEVEQTDFVQAASDDLPEWDNEDGVKDYVLSKEDYQKFFERYFYNPELITATDDAMSTQAKSQSAIDRVTRERRYLLVNSAVHLLQVSATTRREIPIRTKAIEDMNEQAKKASGEMEAIQSYSATRIENARALLLYAKLLCAKIQYLAAKDLLNAENSKTIDAEIEYDKFDLGRYILKSDYVQEMVDKSNQTLDTTAAQTK